MAIPDYQTIMPPLLKFASDQKEHSIHEAIKIPSEQFKLSEADRKELLPSGQQEVFVNRVGWARTHPNSLRRTALKKRGTFFKE